MGLGPDTETTQTEPADVSQFRQGTVNPFLQGLFQNPFGEFQAGPAGGGQQNLGFIDRGAAAFGGGPGGGMTSTGNPFARFLSQNPEQQVLQSQFDALAGLSQGGGLGAAQQVIGAAQPVFNRNLQQASAEFASQAPSTFNTSFGAGLGNLQARALQDFNLFANQALQQGQQTGIDAARTLGGLGQAAGGAQQRFINPTLELLLGGMGLARPLPAEVSSQPGLFGQLLGAGGTAAGLIFGGN